MFDEYHTAEGIEVSISRKLSSRLCPNDLEHLPRWLGSGPRWYKMRGHVAKNDLAL